MHTQGSEMTHKERAKQVVNTSGYRPGGRPIEDPAKLEWHESKSIDTDRCCYVIGYDSDTTKPIFCGEIADFVAKTGPNRSTAMCKNHFDEMGLQVH